MSTAANGRRNLSRIANADAPLHAQKRHLSEKTDRTSTRSPMAELCPKCGNEKHALLACSACGYSRRSDSSNGKPPITARAKGAAAPEATYELADSATSQTKRKRNEALRRKQELIAAGHRPTTGRIVAITAQQIESLERERRARVATYAKKRGISIEQARQELKSATKIIKNSSKINRKTPRKHSTNSLYFSISTSIWPYHS